MASEGENGTLQLAGLAPTVTESLLLSMFRTYGPILRTSITSSGSAHVVFARSANALRAARATNGSVLEGQRIAVSVLRKFKKTNRPCRGFQLGICKQGDNCKYLHVGNSGEGAVKDVVKPVNIPVVATAAEAKARAVIRSIPAKKICQYFRRAGECRNGAACKNAHILNSELKAAQDTLPGGAPPTARTTAVSAPRVAVSAAVVAPAKPPCQYFASGLCTRGDACAFSHNVGAPAASTPAKKEKRVTAKSTPAAANSETAASRTCIECEQEGVAQWQCSKCDDGLYCDECNALVHKSKVMRSHERTKLPPLPVKAEKRNPTCDECEESESSLRCEQCDVVLCASCDASVHKFKSLRNHVRTAISSAVTAPATTTAKQEVVLKKQKVNQSADGGVATKIAYVESVPKYDLLSEPSSSSESEPSDASDSESSESDGEEEKSKMEVDSVPAVAAVKPRTLVASAAAPKIKYVESVPKYDISSESESESDDDEAIKPQQVNPVQVDESNSDSESEEDDDKPAVAAKTAPVQAAAVKLPSKQQPKVVPVRSGDISSESSDDEDERPIVLPSSPVRKIAAPKPVVTASSSSSTSESSDDEDEKPRIASVAVSSKRAAAASSSSDSDSSSSDDDDDAPAPVKKTPAPAKKAPAPAPVVKRAPPKVSRGSGNPGISTGSSHSLVKKIEAYYESGSTEVLHLDANLNGFERLLAHDCAERLGLQHVSVGEGLERHITISR